MTDGTPDAAGVVYPPAWFRKAFALPAALSVTPFTVSPLIAVCVPPRDTEVLPIVMELLASALLGIAEAVTERAGVLLAFATDGTSHVGHVPAENSVTVPVPEADAQLNQAVVYWRQACETTFQ